ncbi:MAG: FAD:protein FMN transferase, partial [Deltaproteobacteria bacterium]
RGTGSDRFLPVHVGPMIREGERAEGRELEFIVRSLLELKLQVEELRRRGFRNFTVQAGGDLDAAGTRGGRPWRVGIRDPRSAAGEPFAWLPVKDAAFSTSGDSERFFVEDGVRHHHIIDTRTCRPATASRQVSVLAPTAIEAEILGKAVFALGGEEGLALAARSGASAVIVTAANQVVSSPPLSGRLEMVRPPTP